MTTITTTRLPLHERQNNYDPRTHANKKDGKPTPQFKPRVPQSPSTNDSTTPSASTFTAATPKKTPSQQQKKAKKQAQIPVLKTDDSYATATKKKIYSKDFLNQYRTVGDQTFPPGEAPADLIRRYNDSFEKKEQAAKAQEIANMSQHPRPVDPNRQGSHSVPVTPVNNQEEKRKKRPAHTSVKVSKFKIEGGESFPIKPKTPARPEFNSTDSPITDKENGDGSSSTPYKKPEPKKKKPTSVKKLELGDNTSSTPTNESELLQKLKALMKQQENNVVESSDDTTAVVVITPSSDDDSAAAVGGADAAKPKCQEQDPRRLEQRQKQIDFGKVTAGYKAYTDLVPKCKRKRDDAKTPNKFQVCSKRSWDGQIRKWRRQLHNYDPEGTPMPGADEGVDGGDDEEGGGDSKVDGEDAKE